MQIGSKDCIVNTLESYVRITLRHKNCVRLTSESYVRLTLESYVIRTCKWNQKVM